MRVIAPLYHRLFPGQGSIRLTTSLAYYPTRTFRRDAMQRLTNPIPLFLDGRGALLDAGHIYVGVADGDPETDPIDLYLDQALTQPIAQPLRTLGGVIVSGANAVFIYCAEEDYSMRVTDVNDQLVSYVPSVLVAAGPGISYQPLDDDLTAIAAIATTAYGRSLLTLANAAALKAATGIVEGLPLNGGTVTGNITRSGLGTHLYHADAAMTSGRVFVTAAAAPDPTSLPGDIWLKY